MNIILPERRLSPAPRLEKRRIPIEQILAVMGNNPVAQSLPGIGKQLGEALMVSAAKKRQQEQMAALGQSVGADAESFSRLSPESANLMARSLMERKENEAKKQDSARHIQLLEQQGGFKPGTLGDDFDSAKLIYTQKAIGGRQEVGIGSKEENAFKNRLNNQKNRMVNDPRIKPLHAQGIGLSQISDVANLARNGNTVAATALGVKMARGMGEVGVMTDSDVTRYVTSGRLDRKAADILSRWLRGTPTDATMAEIQQISDVLKDNFAEKMQPVFNEYIDSFSEVEGLTPDVVSKKMGIPYNPQQTSTPLPTPGQETPQQRKARLFQELSGAR